MALEKLIVCTCRHTIDLHDEGGCKAIGGLESNVYCPCTIEARQVIERIVLLEFKATRERWRDSADITQLAYDET